jgi:hypothetical protein
MRACGSMVFSFYLLVISEIFVPTKSCIKKPQIYLRLIATGQGIEPYHSPVKFSHRKHLHSKTYWHNLSRGMACPPISVIKHPIFVKNPEIIK